MSAPLIWILFPSLVGTGLFFLRRRPRLQHSLGVLTALLLAAAAWWLPMGEPIDLRLWAGVPSLTISDTLLILGRRISLGATARPWLALIFTSASFWFIGAYAARAPSLFIPLGLIITAAITAALAIQPTVYAILIFAILAMICVPLLSAPGEPVPPGVLRFMTFQTLGVALLLLADWLLPLAAVNPGDLAQTLRAVLLLCLGFALVSAILPFHTWAPMLAQDAHPYSVTFVFIMITTSASFLGLQYLERFGRLQTGFGAVADILLLAGIAMILAGGLWAAFERDLGRMLGFGLVTSMGLNLISIALWTNSPAGASRQNLFSAQMLSVQLALAIWTLALSILRPVTGSLHFRAVQGLGRRLPIATLAIALGSFSLAGLPGLASFPTLTPLLAAAGRASPGLVGPALLGLAFSMAAAIRALAVLVYEAQAVPPIPAEVEISGDTVQVRMAETQPVRQADTVPLRAADTVPLRTGDTVPLRQAGEPADTVKETPPLRESRMQRLLILAGCGLLVLIGLLLPWIML